MSNYVIDASVVFKWFGGGEEHFFKESQQIYHQLTKGEIALFAPNFMLLEISNVLFWKRKFEPTDVNQFLDKLLGIGIHFSDCPARNSKDIFGLMQKHQLTSYDSLYLWLAQDRGLKLISVDEKLLAVKETVIAPNQWNTTS